MPDLVAEENDDVARPILDLDARDVAEDLGRKLVAAQAGPHLDPRAELVDAALGLRVEDQRGTFGSTHREADGQLGGVPVLVRRRPGRCVRLVALDVPFRDHQMVGGQSAQHCKHLDEFPVEVVTWELVERLLLVATGVFFQSIGVVVLIHLAAHDLVELLAEPLGNVDEILPSKHGCVIGRVKSKHA